MEDYFLSQTIDHQTIFVSALSHNLYRSAGGQGLGGSEGFFVCRVSEGSLGDDLEILAKAATPESAQMIFAALVANLQNSRVQAAA